MFGIVHYEFFLLSAIILNITPGPDTVYILSRSISQGRMTGVYSALGTGAGCAVHTLLASLGLSVILTQSAMAFSIVKMAGALYLGYLGIRMVITKKGILNVEAPKLRSKKNAFLQGLLIDVLNPKVALFFLSFMPQFIDPQSYYGILPFLLLGLTFIVTGTLWLLMVVYFSSQVSGLLRRNSLAATITDKACGSIYFLLGIKLLTSERN